MGMSDDSFSDVEFEQLKFIGPKYETDITFRGRHFDMARLYLSVMAYPERGSCLPGGKRDAFSCALYEWSMWQFRKQYGRDEALSCFVSLEGKVPEKRQFQAVLNRGLARLNRRMLVLEILFKRMDISLSNNLNNSSLPLSKIVDWGVILNADIYNWSDMLSVNLTGIGRNDIKCKSKDLKRRMIYPSVPVLHLCRGLLRGVGVARNKEKLVPGFNIFLSLLMCSSFWIYDALEAADDFPLLGLASGVLGEFEAASMIRLNWESAQ